MLPLVTEECRSVFAAHMLDEFMPHTSDRRFLEEEVDRLRRRVAELEQQQGQGEVFGTPIGKATEGMLSGNVLSELELHVEQRTTELAKANRKLNEEIEVRKQIAQNLKLSAEIMHNMAEGVCLLRASDGVLVFTNPRFDEIFGYEPGELNGRHTAILNAPGDDTPNEVAEKILQDLQETGKWSGEVHNIRKDGTKLWTHSSVSTFEHPQYGTVRVAVVEDITARKQAEEALRESEQRFRRVFEDGPIGMALVGVDFQIMEVNPALCQMLGYTSAELLSIDIADITHPDGLGPCRAVGLWRHPDVPVGKALHQEERRRGLGAPHCVSHS